MRHHHELSLQESWNYAILTHCTCFTNESEVPIILTSCITIPSCNSCFPIHTTQNNMPFPPQPHISIMASSLNPHSKAFRSDKQSHISPPFNNSIKTYPPVSLRLTGPVQAREVLSLRRAPSRLGEDSSRGAADSARSRSGESLLA